MAEYRLSGKADEDLVAIWLFTYERFGEAQADAYLHALEERFRLLAEQPHLGRKIDHIRAGYLRYAYSSHLIYYTLYDEGVFIVRVLHSSMDTEQHL